MDNQRLFFRLNTIDTQIDPPDSIECVILDEYDTQIGMPIQLKELIQTAELSTYNSKIGTHMMCFLVIPNKPAIYYRIYYFKNLNHWEGIRSKKTPSIHQEETVKYMDLIIKSDYNNNSFQHSR